MNKLLVAGAAIALAAGTSALAAGTFAPTMRGAASEPLIGCSVARLHYPLATGEDDSFGSKAEYNAAMASAKKWHEWAVEARTCVGQRLTEKDQIGNREAEQILDGWYGADTVVLFHGESGKPYSRLIRRLSNEDLLMAKEQFAHGGFLQQGKMFPLHPEYRGTGRRGEGEEQ